MISFNANTSPLPVPYCSRICLMLWRLGYMSLLALIFSSLLRYRETNLLNLVDVWLGVLYYKQLFDYVLSWIGLLLWQRF